MSKFTTMIALNLNNTTELSSDLQADQKTTYTGEPTDIITKEMSISATNMEQTKVEKCKTAKIHHIVMHVVNAILAALRVRLDRLLEGRSNVCVRLQEETLTTYRISTNDITNHLFSSESTIKITNSTEVAIVDWQYLSKLSRQIRHQCLPLCHLCICDRVA